jgi:hypothetical protein
MVFNLELSVPLCPVAGIARLIPPQAIFNSCQNNVKTTKLSRPSGMKFSHINTREIRPAYRAISLSMPARLPYKQVLKTVRVKMKFIYTSIFQIGVIKGGFSFI